MFLLCRIASCLRLCTHTHTHAELECWALKIADCSNTNAVHSSAKDVKKSVMSNMVCSEWLNTKLTAAVSGILCDLKWKYSSKTSGLVGFWSVFLLLFFFLSLFPHVVFLRRNIRPQQHRHDLILKLGSAHLWISLKNTKQSWSYNMIVWLFFCVFACN